MTVFSHMSIKVLPGQRAAALDAFRQRRVFEECAAAIPGFVQAFLLADREDADAVSVIAEWRTAGDFADWTLHPARASQERDLARFLAAAPTTRLLDRYT